jgi:hypothetical protein
VRFVGFYLIIEHLGNLSASLSDIAESNWYKHKESRTGKAKQGKTLRFSGQKLQSKDAECKPNL